MVGAAKSRLESNPIPARVSRRAQTNLLCTRTHPETPETEPELCLKVSCGGLGQQYPATGAGARCIIPGYGMSPHRRGHY